MAADEKGALFTAEGGPREKVIAFLRQAITKNCFDAVLIPVRAEGTDSFSYLLTRDESLLKNAYPLPPIMTVQGAKAVSALTGHGKGKKKIAAVVRPCEARATVELFKLGQVDLENIYLITIDCPGALPLADWAKDAKKTEEVFAKVQKGEAGENLRPTCQICDKFSATGAEDLHIGILGAKGGILLIPNSPKGESLLDCLGVAAEADISGWQQTVKSLTEKRKGERQKFMQEFKPKATGLDNLLDTFSQCINCHNCMRVCPICYCRQCFFDSNDMKFAFEDYLNRAEAAGGLKLPPETLLFHIGRMLHMSLSCVSCGACEDACPTNIPVAQVFSLVGNQNQAEFDYVPGRSREEPLPLRTFEEKEFEEVEQSYAETSAKQEA
ncbi:MAG: 4Fe-4S binding protein [Dehalococcoidia bacterium]|jgi:formate dehydrogenase subunit beta